MKAFVCVKWKSLAKWGAFVGCPYVQSAVWPRSYSWCCGDADTAMGELAVGRAAAPLVPNEMSCTASSFGSSILLLEGGAGGYFDQRKTIWWGLVIGFMTNFACAIQECNWYDMTSVSWKHCCAVLLVLDYTAGTIGSFIIFGGSVSELRAVTAVWAVTAAASMLFLLSILSRAAQRSSRLEGLDIMFFSVIKDGEKWWSCTAFSFFMWQFWHKVFLRLFGHKGFSAGFITVLVSIKYGFLWRKDIIALGAVGIFQANDKLAVSPVP